MATTQTPTFFQDFRAYLHYLRHPYWGPRIRGRRGDGWWSDFKLHTPLRLLLKWLFFLWGINIFVLAPIAYVASASLGANHRINFDIPYLVVLAAVWAPLFEELLFRFGLRRPKIAMYYVPLLIVAMNINIVPLSIAIVVILLILLVVLDLTRQTQYQNAWPFAWRRRYRQFFPFVFHGSVLIFAFMHLSNYVFPKDGVVWLLPLLVLPQWLTGTVIAWMRVRDSFACGVVFHALFNGVPVLLAWTLLQFLPKEMVLSWIF